MMNLKVRFKNPVFIFQFILAIVTPVLAYAGLTVQDMTTWGSVLNLIVLALRNPYVLGLIVISVWNALNDPTTPGVTDSTRSLSYSSPGISTSSEDTNDFNELEDVAPENISLLEDDKEEK